MTETSPWRANDVVAYDAMRESAVRLAALLLSEDSQIDCLVEIQNLRRDVLGINGHDRSAVLELTSRIGARIEELAESRL